MRQKKRVSVFAVGTVMSLRKDSDVSATGAPPKHAVEVLVGGPGGRHVDFVVDASVYERVLEERGETKKPVKVGFCIMPRGDLDEQLEPYRPRDT